MCHICQKWAGKAPAEGRPNLASPSPNVRRDKISRSGEPLTLILYKYYINCLFEGVGVTHVILAPGACGREVPTCWA